VAKDGRRFPFIVSL